MSGLDYEAWVVDALLSVVPRALQVVADEGLPEGHALYVSFDTRHPGVELDAVLAEHHPDLMTVVLEHQFWDLVVDEDGFSVVLAFGGERQSLYVPWASVRAFADPPAEFAFDTSRHLARKVRQLVGEEEGAEGAVAKDEDGREEGNVSDRFTRVRSADTDADDPETPPPAGEVVPFARPAKANQDSSESEEDRED